MRGAIRWGTIVVTMTLAATLRERMTERGIGTRELARTSAVSKSYIDALLSGSRRRVSLDKAEALARALGISVEELTGKPQQRFSSVVDLLDELRRRCEALGMLEVPVRGSVPCPGEPREQIGTVVVPKGLVEGGRVFALECSESLKDDRIEIGDFVVVDEGRDVEDIAHLYVLLVSGETLLRRAWKVGAHVSVAPEIDDLDTIPADSVRVLGRVVLSGRWRRV